MNMQKFGVGKIFQCFHSHQSCIIWSEIVEYYTLKNAGLL